MNAVLIRARRAFAAIGLAALIAIASGTTGLAVAAESIGAGAGEPSVIDGFWAAATCSFSIMLARYDPGFADSAALICARVFGLI